MNRIFRSIWNDKTGTFVAVSENAKSDGRKSSPGATAVARGARFALNGLAVSLMLAFGSNVYAVPAGGAVSAGSASIAVGAGKTTINQSSQNVAINWQSFSIGQGEAVRFVQPNSNSVALNRVLGADPSSILGSLSANGKVFLVNPNGILFDQGAQVNVGGLVASTLTITDGDFMAGRYNFAGAGNGTILNRGSINADGGYVALLGANVSNQGVISAKLGTVALAAGNAVTLDVAGDGLLNVAVNQGALNALVQNGGLIRADGGQVLLSAQAAGNLLPSVVNNAGVIQAQTIENHNGTIRLLGDMQSGSVNVSGTLDTSGTGVGQTGGNVTATARHVGLFGGHIDASGDAGGGIVLVGGDLHGANSAVQNASATYMSADSTITADAITNGSGGKAVLWANDSTRAYGSITARGGARGGDGGLIETSGHWLDVAGLNVNASAPNGKGGTWLLDPADVTITGAVSDGTFNGGNPNVFSPNTGVSTANVAVSDITTALLTTGVTINSANTGASGSGFGDITVTTPIVWSAATTLALNAVRDVNVGAAITGTDGSFAATAGRDVNVTAATKTTTGNLTFSAVRDVNVTAATTVTTGSLTSIAGGNVNVSAATTVTTGNLTSIAGRNVNVSAAMTVTTGDIELRADNDGTGPGNLIGGTVAITCGNCITITTGALRIRFNPVTYANTGTEITDYGLNLVGGSTVAHPLDAKAWVFGLGDDKLYDGTRTATVNSFKPDTSVTLPPVVLGAVTTRLFDTKDVGTNKLITFGSAFTDPVFALFAPFGSTANTGTTRANITPAPLTVKANDATKVYGQAFTPSSTAFTTPVAPQNGETVGSVTEASPAGAPPTASVVGSTYAITPSGATGGTFTPSNYAITYVDGALTVTPAPLSVKANDATKVYGQTFTPSRTAFTTPVAPQNGETVGSVTEASPAGAPPTASVVGSTYAITPSGATGGTFNPSNYTITYANGALTVTPAPLTVKANDATKVYGQTFTPSSTAFTTLVAPQNGETVGSVTEASPTGTPPTAAVPGPYAITPSAATGGTFNPSNYTITYANGALTVTPAPLTVKANDATKVYGQTFTPSSTAFTTPVAPQNGETVGSVTEASPTGTPPTAAVPGPYAITPSSATGGTFTPSNYTITYVNGALTVTPAPLTVTASNATKVFGETPTLSAFTSVGLVNSETIASVTETSPGTVATATAAGSPYAITPSGATGGTFTPANYTVTYVNGALTVTPVIQVIPVVFPPVIPPVVAPPVVVTPPFSPPPDVLAAEGPQIQATVQDTLTSSPLIQYSVGAVTGGLTGLNLAVIGTGVRMPPVQVAEVPVPMVPVALVPEAPPVQPTQVVVPRETPPVQPTPVVVPPEAPPTIYVPPQRPRKPDRN